jgi:hypothetical protein
MKRSTQPRAEQAAEESDEVQLENGMVPSAFITKLRETFLSPAGLAKLWTPDFTKLTSSNRKALIGADIASAFRSVFLRNETHGSAGAEPGGPGSAAKLMKELLEGPAEQWPDDETAFPIPEGFMKETFRRYEVGCSVPILMEAFHRRNPGGEPTDFPPSKPH